MGYIGEGINQTATSVETAKDEFFGTYYGQISSDPSVDPNGNPITDGDLFYNTSEEALKIRVNGEWLSLRTATTGYQQFTATSGQTTFNVAGSFSPGFVFVTLNGVVLSSGDYDDSSGTEIVLTDGAASGDILGVYLFDTFSVADTVSASAGGTFSNDVTVQGTITGNNDGALSGIFNRDSSDGDIVEFRKDGSTVGSISTQVGEVQIISQDALQFGAEGSTFQFMSDTLGIGLSPFFSRDNQLDLGRSGSRFKDLYLSGGVYLGGTGSANYLDDYEEGTFTFTSSSVTLDTGVGEYSKIGNQVVCHFRINFPNTSNTDIASVSGLPFAGSGGNFRAGGSIRFSNAGFNFRINQSGSSITLSTIGGSGNITNQDVSGSTVRGSITYQIA